MPTVQRSSTAVAAAAWLTPLVLLTGCGDRCNESPTGPPPTKDVTWQERKIDPQSVLGKIREVSIGEDFTIRFVSIGEGAAEVLVN